MRRGRLPFLNNLSSQMVAFVAGILLLAMGITTYYQYRNEIDIVDKVMEVRAQSMSEMLAAVSLDALLVYDNVSLNKYARHVTQQSQVVFAMLRGADGTILTRYLNLENPHIDIAISRVGDTDIGAIIDQLQSQDDMVSSVSPVIFSGNKLADAIVILDRGEYLDTTVNKLQQKIILTLLIGISVGLAIYLIFRIKIMEPIRALTRGAKNISQLKFDEPLDVRGHTELSDLSRTFNQMAAELERLIGERDRAQKKLQAMNVSLEERVHERTLELQALNTEMAHQAMHDPLTGLPNRTLLVERLQQSIRLAARHKTRLAFLMIDLNNFKDVNDTLGHHEGDRLLKDVASRIPEALRASDTVGRLGGDEFGIVLPESEPEQAEYVANKILESLSPNFSLDNQVLNIGASIGIAIYPDHGEEQSSLIRHADVAMYEAKKKGGKPCFYDPSSDGYTTERLALMVDLHNAIDMDQLELYYQPQVHLGMRKVVAAEALLRWKHPTFGEIPPDQFIPMAESSTMINLLSDWVLDNVLRQLGEWQHAGIDLRVSVNLSARDLLNPELPHYIARLSRQYDVALDGLTIEITESALMANPKKAMEVLSHPVLRHIQYAIDDFGTGYSSLSYLKKLPVNSVKIDKSFVMDMTNDEEDASIVRSVIELTHSLGHIVVAEGVEDYSTLKMLDQSRCDLAQGYYFSLAVPAAEITDVIRRIEAGLSTGGRSAGAV